MIMSEYIRLDLMVVMEHGYSTLTIGQNIKIVMGNKECIKKAILTLMYLITQTNLFN